MQGEGTLSATGEVLSLNREATVVGVTVQESIALQDAKLRTWTAARTVWTFIGANIAMWVAVGLLVWRDEVNLRAHLLQPGERIINGQVIMALLGATTVQLGTIAVIIARHLFPSRTGGQ